MECHYTYKMSGGKTLVTLLFKREELLYDIENYSYVEGDVMQTNAEHERHQVTDVGQDGNIDRVTRVLYLAHAECVNMLYPYTKQPVDIKEGRDNTLTEMQEYEIRMVVPGEMSKTTITLLERLIHEYMVYRVLSDWMSITKPTSKVRRHRGKNIYLY